MARVVHGGTKDQWKAFLQQSIAKSKVGSSPHHVLPVALDEQGFQLSESQHFLPALIKENEDPANGLERRLAEISLHIAARAIQLLDNNIIPESAPGQIKAPVRLFLSHAKASLDNNKEDPVHQTMQELNDLPIDYWFDAGKIATSQEFGKAITAGIKDCSIILAFHTDQFGSRPWCRREVLDAKKMGGHLLLIDALQEGEPRRFPYLGNVPTVRWNFQDPKVDARRVVDRAVLEALRFKYNRALLEQVANAGEIVVPAPPEALTLAYDSTPEQERTYLYPDPPLSHEELGILQALRPNTKFLTPLTKIADWEKPKNIDAIAVSISSSNDIHRYGLSNSHQQTLTDEIHLYLLLAGLRIGYGGALKGNFADASNFTLRLFELVRGYSQLAKDLQATSFHPIINYPPWPLVLDYGNAEWNLFGSEAECKEVSRPDLPWSDEKIFPQKDEGWRLLADTSRKRYAWARGLTLMRNQITSETQARLVIGGNIQKFQGLIPGVIEEIWFSLKNKKPIFIIGGFGGAARAVCDLLMGLERDEEFSETYAREHIPNYDDVISFYHQYGVKYNTMQSIRNDIIELSKKGLSSTLNNGLNDSENEALMLSTEAMHITKFVLQGLSKIP